jgi:formiminoglutamate deiminase
VTSVESFWCEHAWVDGAVRGGVLVGVADGRVTAVSAVDGPPPGANRLHGLVLPGMANAHSHAFHRALRGRTHHDGGTFWTWREAMYALASRLDPDGYRRLAAAAYSEMVLAGWTSVGEFHYLHHPPGGGSYDDPNVMADALRDAAASAGIRLTLLDACYLAGGFGEPVSGTQLRFCDGTADRWARRVADLRPGPGFAVGVAVHSVRAVPVEALPTVVAAGVDRPLHVHLSEQPAENTACLAHHGRTPTRLLHDAGALGPLTTAVHATHLRPGDLRLLGSSGTTVNPCPTTEADLADGIGPMRELVDAGCGLALGTDQHAVVDPFAEARGLEAGERLRSRRRGRFTPAELVDALTLDGQFALGWADAGRIAVGARADLVAVRLDSPRTAGCRPDQVVLAASAADVHTVVVDGKLVVAQGRHREHEDVGRMLAEAIEEVWA